MPHHGLQWNLYNETGVSGKEKRSCFQPCQEQYAYFSTVLNALSQKSTPRKNPELTGLVGGLNGEPAFQFSPETGAITHFFKHAVYLDGLSK